MDNYQLATYLRSVSAAINGFTAICRKSIEDVQACEQRLSNQSFSKLQTSKLCSTYIEEILQVFNYMILPVPGMDNETFTNFEIEELIEKICLHFQDTVSEYITTSINHFSRLDRSFSILINKHKFELLILNILHCCLKSNPESSKKAPKISFYVTETKKDIVFHIRDNSETIGADFVEASFNFSPPIFIEDFSYNIIKSLNLSVAQKSAQEMDGSVRYIPLKSGNRFDIYLPKQRTLPKGKLYSLAPYFPDHALFLEIFSDIIKPTQNNQEVKKL